MLKRLVLTFFGLFGALLAQQNYDLVVYGGTAGGVMTAIAEIGRAHV